MLLLYAGNRKVVRLLPARSSLPGLPEQRQRVGCGIAVFLRPAEKKARNVLPQSAGAGGQLDALAEALLEKETMNGEEIRAVPGQLFRKTKNG